MTFVYFRMRAVVARAMSQVQIPRRDDIIRLIMNIMHRLSKKVKNYLKGNRFIMNFTFTLLTKILP